jgi:hypothetical protein
MNKAKKVNAPVIERSLSVLAQAFTPRMTKEEIRYCLIEMLSGLASDPKSYAGFRKLYAMLDVSPVMPSVMGDGVVSTHLKTMLSQYLPTKEVIKFSETYACGYKRVGTVMKILPPLVALFGCFPTKKSQLIKPNVDYIGAAGFAHIKAVWNFCHPMCYDLKGNDVVDEDHPKGKYRITRRDYFVIDDDVAFLKIAIIDVFNKDMHAYADSQLNTATDPGMHCIASAAMRGFIFNKKEKLENEYIATGSAHGWDSGIFKGRLPTKDFQHYYRGLKFLIFCTGGLESEEVYFVWWRNITDEQLVQKHRNVVAIYKSRKSIVVPMWSAVITNLAALESFVVKCYQMKIVFCASIMQIPIIKMDTVIEYPFFRDWDVPHNCMPVVYGDSSMKPFLPNHVTKAMIRAQEMELNAWDASAMRYEAYREEAAQKTGGVPDVKVEEPEVPLNNIFVMKKNNNFQDMLAAAANRDYGDLGGGGTEEPQVPHLSVSGALELPELPIQYHDDDGYLFNFEIDAASLVDELKLRIQNKHPSIEDTQGIYLYMGGYYWMWGIVDGVVTVQKIDMDIPITTALELFPIGLPKGFQRL